MSQPLTIKPAVSLGKGGQKELAVLFNSFQEVPLALQGQRLLHLTGTAGVVLRTEPQVLTWSNVNGNYRIRITLLIPGGHCCKKSRRKTQVGAFVVKMLLPQQK